MKVGEGVIEFVELSGMKSVMQISSNGFDNLHLSSDQFDDFSLAAKDVRYFRCCHIRQMMLTLLDMSNIVLVLCVKK